MTRRLIEKTLLGFAAASMWQDAALGVSADSITIGLQVQGSPKPPEAVPPKLQKAESKFATARERLELAQQHFSSVEAGSAAVTTDASAAGSVVLPRPDTPLIETGSELSSGGCSKRTFAVNVEEYHMDVAASEARKAYQAMVKRQTAGKKAAETMAPALVQTRTDEDEATGPALIHTKVRVNGAANQTETLKMKLRSLIQSQHESAGLKRMAPALFQLHDTEAQGSEASRELAASRAAMQQAVSEAEYAEIVASNAVESAKTVGTALGSLVQKIKVRMAG